MKLGVLQAVEIFTFLTTTPQRISLPTVLLQAMLTTIGEFEWKNR